MFNLEVNEMKGFKRFAAVSALSMSMLGGSAYAADSTTTFTVSLTVLESCLVVATPLTFVDVPSLASNNDAQSTVTATCTIGSDYQIGLDDGVNADVTQRRLHDGSGNYVNYDMYTDSSRTTRWDDIGGTTTQGDDGSDVDGIKAFTVYGRVPSGQSVSTGIFTDTVTVTVSF